MVQTPVIPVAVIAMACRLPGGIDSPEAFWDALLRGDDLITEIPAERWDVDEYYDPERGVPGRSISRWGGLPSNGSMFANRVGDGSRSPGADRHYRYIWIVG